mgnify:FL=1
MDLRGYACAGADGQIGTCLAVIDALLSMPEDERRRRWAAERRRDSGAITTVMR